MTEPRFRYGLGYAAREHLLSGEPITRLEAIVLFGVSNLTDIITNMRRQGWIVKSKRIPLATAVRRINKYAVVKPPSNLPTREIVLTEYRISK